MNAAFHQNLQGNIDAMAAKGTLKKLRYLQGPMAAVTPMEGHGDVIILSSNNYLGLANDPAVIGAGQQALTEFGAGTASVRFICGTFAPHRDLESLLAKTFKFEAALTYVSCWAANTGAIPVLVTDQDAIVSDELNHASIIDGVRIARQAERKIYKHANMADLEAQLKSVEKKRFKLVITDGVFSMEGDIAPLAEIVTLAEKYGAAVMVDDSHGTGVIGKTGRGVLEHCGVEGKVDILTSTLGKALGGAAGGFVASSAGVIETLTQQSRPMLFSNALPVTIARSAQAAVEVMLAEPKRVKKLHENVKYMRGGLQNLGFKPLEGQSAIIPIIVGATEFAIKMSNEMLKEGVFVTGFGYPVVPEGTARVRVQMSAALEKEHLDRALAAFKTVGKRLKLI
ncbi:MAG TPA: glycine C-acetyltransferase [Planctomycetota bacterium]|nr:glycine C-acetyltransferase [Planctomycetota bacterium]